MFGISYNNRNSSYIWIYRPYCIILHPYADTLLLVYTHTHTNTHDGCTYAYMNRTIGPMHLFIESSDTDDGDLHVFMTHTTIALLIRIQR